ncbi:anti-sigma factor family protein [Paucibacter sp. Y2R2-4]|uniref:anti-sigma factor family protein n=1 Tax=Paucibacter sp. Y2R2-4 TaxID=2893553 RepID=UPI0021E39375|nr:anti-sigma factor [Paucibacter sp. Y2R2-4]MCV2350476.1 zf-HC2 domain-containing protein [Paucibacter sp. Y2R2-4]
MDASTHSQESAHVQAWELIPWVLNGSADPAQRQSLEAHLHQCPDCREEMQFQQKLRQAMQQESAERDDTGDADAALRRFWAQEHAPSEAAALPKGGRPRFLGLDWPRAMAAALLVQALGLGLLWQRYSGLAQDYQVLSQPAAPTTGLTPRIRLVPSPHLQLGELQSLLQSHGLLLVQSSPEGQFFGLAPHPDARKSVPELVKALRAEPGVLLAEPLGPTEPAATQP